MKTKRKTIIALATIVIIAIACILWPVKKDINVIDGNETKKIVTYKETVEEMLIEEGIKINDNDVVEPDVKSKLDKGMIVRIKRARDILIVDGGNEIKCNTTMESVYQIIKEKGIELRDDDKIIPGLDEKITDRIQIIRVAKETETDEKSIPYQTIKKIDDDLYKGEQRVIKMGHKGIEKITYEVTYEDGEEVARKILDKIVTKEPVTRILAEGTKQIVSRGSNNIEFKRSVEMLATGYTHTGNRTYTGIWPSVGIAAVDPKEIPLGTRLYIDGYGFAKAMDIGGDIKGKRIDLFFDTRKEAMNWGMRNVKVFVLE